MLSELHGDLTAEEFEGELRRFTHILEPWVGFLAFSDAGEPLGMIDTRIRNFAEGAPNLRAAYVEDLWVAPEHRGKGIARQLLGHVEQWARGQDLDWLGSDARLENDASHAWHRANGFQEVEKLVVFGKRLD